MVTERILTCLLCCLTSGKISCGGEDWGGEGGGGKSPWPEGFWNPRVCGFGVCGDREEKSIEETSDLILEVMLGRAEHEGCAFLSSVTLTLALLFSFFRGFTM